jgi:hypothetical protein
MILRARLRELADKPDERPASVLMEFERVLLGAYVDRFNARDFDAIRDMLADEVRLEVVARTRMNGRKEVGGYLHNYSSLMDWHFTLVLWKGVRRRWSATMTLCRENRLILFCWNGKAASF